MLCFQQRRKIISCKTREKDVKYVKHRKKEEKKKIWVLHDVSNQRPSLVKETGPHHVSVLWCGLPE